MSRKKLFPDPSPPPPEAPIHYTELLTFWVEDGVRDFLKGIAKAKGISMSELLRRIVARAVREKSYD